MPIFNSCPHLWHGDVNDHAQPWDEDIIFQLRLRAETLIERIRTKPARVREERIRRANARKEAKLKQAVFDEMEAREARLEEARRPKIENRSAGMLAACVAKMLVPPNMVYRIPVATEMEGEESEERSISTSSSMRGGNVSEGEETEEVGEDSDDDTTVYEYQADDAVAAAERVREQVIVNLRPSVWSSRKREKKWELRTKDRIEKRERRILAREEARGEDGEVREETLDRLARRTRDLDGLMWTNPDQDEARFV